MPPPDPATIEAHRALLYRWYEEVWNQQREAAIDELFAPDAMTHGFPEPDSTDDVVGFKVFYRRLRSTFSDIHIDVQDSVCEGDKGVVRWMATLTHTGDGFGIPPTGERVKVAGMTLCHFRDGRIQDAWDVYDLAGTMQHLSRVAALQAKAAESPTA